MFARMKKQTGILNLTKEHGFRIECNVTMRCNARCQHCNKAVGYASFDDTDMTVEQMRKAIDLLLEQEIRVPRFTFCGGEPILNKNLQGLINEVARLNTLKLGRVLTNGLATTEKLRDKIVMPDKRFKWIVNALDDIHNPLSGKNDRTKRPNGRVHNPFWISPADIGMEANFAHCAVQGWCGVGLDSTGFSMCGKAVMFGKLFGIDPTLREGDILQHVNTGIEEICKHCQYGLVGGEKDERVIFKRHKAGELPEVSPTFERVFADHAKNGDLVQLVSL